ncbi:sugar phosphate isomerase/epimerase family protein [Actinoallomurus rhizosphaericola]|uniref:sugar phosphate isomerase/epimerase family protein n=1 Tax=Actinoallomurus rhizosphaericola TaxID=2952536 RepID=UPI0020927BC9|nr:TIM barrel protein [Actinoallomurus rhizosphaericola]MCO5997905.1 TIM barrel protein [Actinoallomurus rhizosphaericola]
MTVQYQQYSLAYTLDSISRCGFTAIEFWAGAPHYHRADHATSLAAERRLRSIHRALSDAGLRVVVYTPEMLSYPYSLAAPDRALRERTIDYLTTALAEAPVLGCDTVFLNSGCGPRDVPREESWQRMVESVAVLAERAERAGVRLVIEQLQPYESNLVTSLPEVLQLRSEVPSRSLQVCVDVVAMAVAGETLASYFDRLGPAVGHIHLADSNHEVLGDGTLPLGEYLDELAARDYAQFVTLEINDPIYWLDPHDSVERSARYLRDHLGVSAV